LKSIWRIFAALVVCLVGLFAAGDQARAEIFLLTGDFHTPYEWCNDIHLQCFAGYNDPNTAHYYYGIQGRYYWLNSSWQVALEESSSVLKLNCQAPLGWTNCGDGDAVWAYPETCTDGYCTQQAIGNMSETDWNVNTFQCQQSVVADGNGQVRSIWNIAPDSRCADFTDTQTAKDWGGTRTEGSGCALYGQNNQWAGLPSQNIYVSVGGQQILAGTWVPSVSWRLRQNQCVGWGNSAFEFDCASGITCYDQITYGERPGPQALFPKIEGGTTEAFSGPSGQQLSNCQDSYPWNCTHGIVLVYQNFYINKYGRGTQWASDAVFQADANTGTVTAQYFQGAVAAAEYTPGIVNGSFEHATLGGWSTSGTTSLVTGGSDTSHDGYAAQAGTNTQHAAQDSSLSQTFLNGVNHQTLEFYYQGHCHDYLYGGYATATLKDNTTGGTATILPRTCTRDTIWHLVQASVTPGDNYTLTLTNHDDGNGGLNPTWTIFDQVKVL
jgi:hypothetical protein